MKMLDDALWYILRDFDGAPFLEEGELVYSFLLRLTFNFVDELFFSLFCKKKSFFFFLILISFTSFSLLSSLLFFRMLSFMLWCIISS